jgi:hypothetical protein
MLVRIEVRLYRNPEGSDNLFFCNDPPCRLFSSKQINMELKQLETQFKRRVSNKKNKNNMKKYQITMFGKESEYVFMWYDVSRGKEVTSEMAPKYNKQVLNYLSKNQGKLLSEDEKKHVRYWYHNNCNYCMCEDFENFDNDSNSNNNTTSAAITDTTTIDTTTTSDHIKHCDLDTMMIKAIEDSDYVDNKKTPTTTTTPVTNNLNIMMEKEWKEEFGHLPEDSNDNTISDDDKLWKNLHPFKYDFITPQVEPVTDRCVCVRDATFFLKFEL